MNMGRIKAKRGQTFEKIGISIPADLVKWMDSEILADRYASRSHVIRAALRELKDKD